MTAQRQRRPVVLLRPVPGTSVIHQLWAGTKIIVVFVISLLLAFYPGWVPIGLMAALVAVVVWLARIPRGVLPSIPRWLWILLLIGCVLATIGGGEPVLHLFSADDLAVPAAVRRALLGASACKCSPRRLLFPTGLPRAHSHLV